MEHRSATLDPLRRRVRAREVHRAAARAPPSPPSDLPEDAAERLSRLLGRVEERGVTTETNAAGRWWRGPTAEVAIVILALVAFALAVVPTLDEPLLESHGFRQTQTAYTARIFHQDGIDLLHPKLPVLGEPFEAPFESPLFQAAA